LADTTFTNAVTLTDAEFFQHVNDAVYKNTGKNILSSVSGTNTITATANPVQTAHKTGQVYVLTPANTNTGPTTITIGALTAKGIYYNNAPCNGGELIQNIPVQLLYDGSQFNILPTTSTSGSWSPTIEGTSVGGTQTYTNGPVGRYRRIFDMVFFWAYIQMSAEDALTSGNIRVVGLPIAASNVTNMQYAVTVTSWNFDLDAGYTQVSGYVVPNTTQIQLTQMGDNVAPILIDDTNLLGTSQLAIQGMYFI
jgi:hypothetical protein